MTYTKCGRREFVGNYIYKRNGTDLKSGNTLELGKGLRTADLFIAATNKYQLQ